MSFWKKKKAKDELQEGAVEARRLYEALIEAGFTEDEAMKLITDTIVAAASNSTD